MYTQTLISAAVLVGACAAQSASSVDPVRSEASANYAALTSQYAGAASAINAWESTETAVPTEVVESQAKAYVSATARSDLPSFITAVPSSLQAPAASILQGDASIIGLASVAAAASSGLPSHSANGTGAPTTPAQPTVSTNPTNAAGKNSVMMAAGALTFGMVGVLAML
ncbi:hypothetical protein ACLMJK_002497 [Lecanora helva]